MPLALDALIQIAPEITDCLENGRPVVALESTIITHGLPWPENEQLAERVEEVVRAEGATPATIAVLDGVFRIGLSAAERQSLARAYRPMKLSRADLAFALASGKTGGTTVAATMIAAARCGIRVFATGGIGGVHAGAHETFDISADLEELARTPVIVVSAGPKAILDLGATLEVLETLGVPVICYRSDRVPAFWSRISEFPAPLRLDSAKDIARMDAVRRALELKGGMLVTNPIPEQDEIPFPELSKHIAQANEEARSQGISGKTLTPFLLSRMIELTGGRSLTANLTLVENNARLAAQIAKAICAGGA